MVQKIHGFISVCSALQVLGLVLTNDLSRHLLALLMLRGCTKTEFSLQSFREVASITKNVGDVG